MKNLIAFIVISTFAISSLFAGGPWPQKKGKGYFKISEWWTIFDQHYTDTGLSDPNVTTGIFNTSFYGEYGITDRLTTVVNAPLFSRNYMNNLKSMTTQEIIIPGEAINTFGDIDLGVKYGLTKPGKLPISLTLILGIPTGKASGGTLGNLATGDGEFNQTLQVDVGGGFKLGKLNFYSSAYAGINNRTKEFSEEFKYGLEIGVGLLKQKLWVNSKLNGVQSFNNGATAETSNSSSIFANNAEFNSIAFEAALYLTKKVGVSAGYATAINGKIIAAAPSYSVGVFLDLSK